MRVGEGKASGVWGTAIEAAAPGESTTGSPGMSAM